MSYKHNIVYKTTNLVNGKIYIGVHGTDDLEDGYLGTGRIIKKAIKKYGKENFKREILFNFDNPDEAYKKEKELVTEKFVKNPNTYNLFMGGLGGRKFTEDQRRQRKKWLEKNKHKFNYKKGEEHHCYGIKLSKERCEAISKRMAGENNPMYKVGENHPLFGKALKKEHKLNISFGNIGKEEHHRRLKDIKESDKSFGWMAKLSKKWGVTNRTGLMFIKKWYPDYKPQTKHADNFCKCGKKISNHSKKCLTCHNKEQKNPSLVKMTNEEFELLLWSKPLQKICEEYRTTYRTIKGMAEEKNIVLPSQGYWSTGKNQYSSND
jgi:hypothetical protein